MPGLVVRVAGTILHGGQPGLSWRVGAEAPQRMDVLLNDERRAEGLVISS